MGSSRGMYPASEPLEERFCWGSRHILLGADIRQAVSQGNRSTSGTNPVCPVGVGMLLLPP